MATEFDKNLKSFGKTAEIEGMTKLQFAVMKLLVDLYETGKLPQKIAHQISTRMTNTINREKRNTR